MRMPKFSPSVESLELLDMLLAMILSCDNKDSFNYFASLQRVVPKDELTNFEYTIYELLERKRQSRRIFKSESFILSESIYKDYVRINIGRLLKDEHIDVNQIISETGQLIDLNAPNADTKLAPVVFGYLAQRYRQVTALASQEKTFSDVLENLKDQIKKDLITFSSVYGINVLEGEVEIDRIVYKGVDDYSAFQSKCISLIQNRTRDFSETDQAVTLRTIEDYDNEQEAHRFDQIVLTDSGVEPWQDIFNFRTGELAVIVGDEGVGKTTYMAMKACDMMLNGHSVIFMRGESKPLKIGNMILSRYIFKKYGLKIRWESICNAETELNEKVRLIVRKAQIEFFSNPEYGKITYLRQFSYENFTDELINIINKSPDITYRAVFLDHIDFLSSTGEMTSDGRLYTKKERIDHVLRSFIKVDEDFNLCIVVSAHSNTATANKSGITENVRIAANSGDATKDADTVIHIARSADLDKLGCVIFDPKKGREIDVKKLKPVVMQKDFNGCNYAYHPEHQALIGNNIDLDEYIGEN